MQKLKIFVHGIFKCPIKTIIFLIIICYTPVVVTMIKIWFADDCVIERHTYNKRTEYVVKSGQCVFQYKEKRPTDLTA